MSRPIQPHPVNPARPRPLPAPRPNPPRPSRFTFRMAVAFPVIGVLSIAAGATGNGLLRAAVIVASYVFLHVSLAHLPAPRHRLPRFARAHGPVPFEGCGAGLSSFRGAA